MRKSFKNACDKYLRLKLWDRLFSVEEVAGSSMKSADSDKSSHQSSLKSADSYEPVGGGGESGASFGAESGLMKIFDPPPTERRRRSAKHASPGLKSRNLETIDSMLGGGGGTSGMGGMPMKLQTFYALLDSSPVFDVIEMETFARMTYKRRVTELDASLSEMFSLPVDWTTFLMHLMQTQVSFPCLLLVSASLTHVCSQPRVKGMREGKRLHVFVLDPRGNVRARGDTERV